MPGIIHPLLEQDAKQAESVPEEQPKATVEETLAAISTPEPTPDAPVTVPEEDAYRISKRDLYKELSRLEREDPEFRNNLNSLVGRKVAREYKPRLAEAEAKAARLEAELAKRDLQAFNSARTDDPDGFARKLLEDDRLRERYEQIRSYQPADPASMTEAATFEVAIDEIFDTAAEHIPATALAQFDQALRTGWYDAERDANGTPGRTLTPQESLARLSRDINRYAVEHTRTAAAARQPAPRAVTAPAPAPAPEPEAAKPNPALGQATPDLSAGSGPTGGKRPLAYSEFRQLSRSEQVRVIDNELGGDFSSAARKGLVDMSA